MRFLLARTCRVPILRGHAAQKRGRPLDSYLSVPHRGGGRVRFFYRLPGLERRLMHTDEAILGIKLADDWNTGVLKDDPFHYKGPRLHQVSRIWGVMRGWADSRQGLKIATIFYVNTGIF